MGRVVIRQLIVGCFSAEIEDRRTDRQTEDKLSCTGQLQTPSLTPGL